MLNKAYSLPSTPTQSASSTSSKKRFGKKLYVAIAAVAVIAVIVAALMLPQGAATIPLTVNYTVGEKMMYTTTETMAYHSFSAASSLSSTVPPLNNTSIDSNSTVEVVGFEGEYYTLNHTVTIPLNQKPFSASILEKVSKTGYSTYIIPGLAQSVSNISSNPFLTELLNRPEVKVGDIWTVPFPTAPAAGNSSASVTGDLTMTFVGFEDLTVPAGSYRVFRVDMTCNNFHYNPSTNLTNSTLISVPSLTFSGQMYMEYGTCRQIKSTMQMNTSYQSSMFNYSISMSGLTELIQDIKP
jgi:hypothetical protein